MKQIAALYVQSDGCYFGLPNVDLWDIVRDARLYDGDYPVVVHPPCARWCMMSPSIYAHTKKEKHRPGNDGGCFESALAVVNRCGGVLEHPASTFAWDAHGLVRPVRTYANDAYLIKPEGNGWTHSGDGWTCVVWQSAYGHRANKATWLYYRGVQWPFGMKWERPKGTHRIGNVGPRKWNERPKLVQHESNATPDAFRDELIKLALHSKG